ncbi:Ion transport 2 [Penicillium bovifimosum]|uniref:Ion transport 2 n=1 Tax=Penicillium bovifimosum TaxID=126998 RepID=A0A9W9GJ78_9EURO|nr:Ion transport 2 [Penicillium bovifimosum]KAJ5121440.1 Ion transport 2 [Penicillium bovifimosum]
MQHGSTTVETPKDNDSDGLSVWERFRSQFTMRPPEDDEPQSWWVASTAIPLVAAATGPLANVMSIVALVMPWRSKIITMNEGPAGTFVQEGYPDPHWITALNAISLVCGIVGNAFLLFNFTQVVRYIIALPVTIILWFSATGILCGVTLATNIYAPPIGPDRLYSEAYWSAVIAAILYFVLSSILMINMLGYFLGKYPQHFSLTDEQRTLILQMSALGCWLLIGAAIFQQAIGISFADALYFCDVTILTLGFGDITATSSVARGVLWPYAVIGVIIVGLIVGSIHKFAREVHYDNVVRKHIEHKRHSTFQRSISRDEFRSGKRPSSEGEISAPTLAHQTDTSARRHGPFRNTIDAITPNRRRPRLLVMREEKDRFDAMRRIQHDTMRFRRWNNLILSIIAFGIVWSCGAVVFWQLEPMTYFESLYFCFCCLLTIGYGDFTPQSNASRPFFVLWSLIAIPTMTMLISQMSDTVVARFKHGTEVVANYLILPQSHLYKSFLARIPGLPQFILSRQSKKRVELGFTLEGAAADASSDSVESGQPHHDDSLAESHPRQTLEELARDPSSLELAQQLAFAIRRVTRHARESKRKHYSYEEWVEFTRLIQFTDPRSRESASQGAANEESHVHIEDEYGLVNWDWIGENSPLVAKQSEPEWVLDRLCESLVRYVSTQESQAVGGAESGEEVTLRKERDIGLDE